MKVFKFGGASVKDAEAVRNVSRIIGNYKNDNIVVVVSAMGKTTNDLENLIKAHYDRSKKRFQILEIIKSFHIKIIDELFNDKQHAVYQLFENTIGKLEQTLQEDPIENYNFYYDQIVSYGELLSTKIISHYAYDNGTNNRWVDARNLIRTDNIYREAKVKWNETAQLITTKTTAIFKEAPIIITQGFIGATDEKLTTTLGREGSDFSAAIIASCLNAEEVSVWKDVPGILNADPRKFDFARKLDTISYNEAIEMTYYGAKVLHPKTIKPLENKRIPLRVRSFKDINESGTLVEKLKIDPTYPPIVILEPNQILISIQTQDFSFITEENMQFIYGLCAKNYVKVNMMQNSAITLNLCCDYVAYKINPIILDLEESFDCNVINDAELLTIRHYNYEMIYELTKEKDILLEQKSKQTYQFVIKDA